MDPSAHTLAADVMQRVPELASWDEWYRHPRVLANGNLHTILAAKLRVTRGVRYHRQLLITPDGGTIALDHLVGVRRGQPPASLKDGVANLLGSAATLLAPGGAPIAGLAEDTNREFTAFVDEPPPLDPERPLMLLASGLGGGSQDTYIRSMAAAAAERGWQVAVMNMRACGGSPVTSPRLFSAYRGANDDVRFVVRHIRETRLAGGSAPLVALGWSNSGTIVNNVLAEQATTHTDASHAIDAAACFATPLNMPANSANLDRPFHDIIYDANLGRSLRNLWEAGRDQYIDAGGKPFEVPRWDGVRTGWPLGNASGTFIADDAICRTGRKIRDLDEGLTRRQFGYDSVDDYYAAASSDQRLSQIQTPLLLMNAYDDPIAPGPSLLPGIEAARDNPLIIYALTSHGGHMGWCDRDDSGPPWGGPSWVERAALSFLEVALRMPTPREGASSGMHCELFD